MKQRKVYVAGASQEVARARYVMDKLREMGFEITGDWTVDIEAEDGVANPADRDTARHYALKDFRAVFNAHQLLLLLPYMGNKTTGAWWEAGFFSGIFAALAGPIYGTPFNFDRPIPNLITAGPAPDRSIFNAVAERHFFTDDEAIAYFRTRKVSEDLFR